MRETFRALRSRNYRLFFVGQGLSLIGTWMQSVAMSWLVYRITHGSGFWLGVVGFWQQVPMFLVSPLAGVFADRVDRRKLLILTQSLQALQALVLALLVFGCRGGLAKVGSALDDPDIRAQVLSLRLAVLFHHARTPLPAPRIKLKVAKRIHFSVSQRWLDSHPLTAHLLAKERAQWDELGYGWKAFSS